MDTTTHRITVSPDHRTKLNTGRRFEVRVYMPAQGYGEAERFDVDRSTDPTVRADEILRSRWGIVAVWGDPTPTGALVAVTCGAAT